MAETLPGPETSSADAGVFRAPLLEAELALLDAKKPVAAPSIPEQRFGFNARSFARLMPSGLEVRTLPDFAVEATVPLEGPRALLPFVGRDWFVAADHASYRLTRGAARPQKFLRIPLFDARTLYPDPQSPEHVYLLYPSSRSVYRYPLERGERSFALYEDELALPGFDGIALALLGSGDWVYSAGDRLRVHGRSELGSLFTQSLPQPLWRLVAARRRNQVWWLSGRGQACRLELWPRFHAQVCIELGAVAFEVQAVGANLALSSVEQGVDGARRWWLEVWSETGKSLMRTALPSSLAGDPTLTGELRNRAVALASERWVAVGGDDWLRIYDFQAQRLVFSLGGPEVRAGSER